MEYRNLGRTGLKVSRIALGCMSYGDPTRGNHSWVMSEDEGRPSLAKYVNKIKKWIKRSGGDGNCAPQPKS